MKPPLHLRVIRAALRRLNAGLSRREERLAARLPPPEDTDKLAEAIAELRKLDLPDDDARRYFEKHLTRLARTLILTPRPRSSGRVLELGCYMQITPFLARWAGYREVRGGYYGEEGATTHRQASVARESFEMELDLFNVERDPFPYPDAYFETVVAGELIEHLIHDPMHFLLECRRVLEDGGHLLLTTPNAASLTSVARALHGYDNPQLWSKYARGADETPHVREYTAHELRKAVVSAGFEIELLFTEPDPDLAVNLPMAAFLEEHGYNAALRGEQTYCLAVKRSALPVTRYPSFLYAD